MWVPRFIVAQAIAALFVSVASAAASAQPVLYRIQSLSSSAYLEGPLPAAVHAPISMPTSAPRVATMVTNGTQPASILFNGENDFFYSNRWLDPSPATAFGVYYHSRGWVVDPQPGGLLQPNTAHGTTTGTPDGFPPLPPHFPSTAPQAPLSGFVRVKPGPARFGGSWNLGLALDQNLGLISGVGGGFEARSYGFDYGIGRVGVGTYNTHGLAGRDHPTTNPTSPLFSSTACPATPATCPWAGSTTPIHDEVHGVRWTTGMVTAVGTFDILTIGPPYYTMVGTGADNRSGPMSSLGTLQLVSGRVRYTRGILDHSRAEVWRLTIEFLPEPGPTVLLASGLLGLLGIHRLRLRRQRRHST